MGGIFSSLQNPSATAPAQVALVHGTATQGTAEPVVSTGDTPIQAGGKRHKNKSSKKSKKNNSKKSKKSGKK